MNKKKNNSIKSILAFYEKAEKLKTTMRHSWLAHSDRQESSAEHSWMLGMLAIVLFSEIETEIDRLKVLKMVIVHDLAEAVTGDIPSFEISVRQEGKYAAERKALELIVSDLPENTSTEILSLWEEMEACQTPEAKFAHSLDKIEVLMQHNLADISTWDEGDFRIGPYYKDHYFNFDTFMREFKNRVDRDTIKKVIETSSESKIDPKHLDTYKKNEEGK